MAQAEETVSHSSHHESSSVFEKGWTWKSSSTTVTQTESHALTTFQRG